MSSLRILVAATKAPYPPIEGGNAALDALLRALANDGAEVRVVAPGRPCDDAAPYPMRVVATGPRPWLRVARHFAAGLPVTVARYNLRPLADAVESELATFRPQVVHIEQAQLAWLVRRLAARWPVVLREQNVESRILERLATVRAGIAAWVLRREARRTAAVEAWACTAAGAVAAISEPDADVLRRLAAAARVVVLPAPLPSFFPAGAPVLAGDPPLLCLGSFRWLPNRDGAEWLLRAVWPIVRELLPRAVLHLAGRGSESLGKSDGPAVRRHGEVASAAAMYDPRAVALVPLRAGSGVRLRILEAWMARVPVVTTAIGGEGLVGADGEGALIADDPFAFATAIASLATDPALRAALVLSGEGKLERHRPDRVGRLAAAMYRETIERHLRTAERARDAAGCTAT